MMDFKDVNKAVVSGFAFSFSPQFRAMSKIAGIIDSHEHLILKHRGKERLEHLKHLGLTTVQSYRDLIQQESDQIQRELMLKNIEL